MPKRLALVGDHVCQWIDYAEPVLKENQIRFRTEVASGKYGTFAGVSDGGSFAGRTFDGKMRLFVEGDKPLCAPPSATNPLGFGTSAVGVVTEVDPAVTRFKAGDRIATINTDIRETNVIDEQFVWDAKGLNPLAALCAEPAYVAFHCIRESNVRYGDSVAVVGIGALGLIAVAMAKEAGAAYVAAVDLSPGRRQLAAKFGADDVFDPRAGDVALEIHKRTGGAGVDIAIELGGSYHAPETAIRCTRICGTVCSAGFYQGEAKGLWLGREWHHNRLSMVVPHGCGFGHPPRDFPRWDQIRAFNVIFDQMRRGRLDIAEMVHPVVGMNEATDLFRRTRDEPDRVIKFAVQF